MSDYRIHIFFLVTAAFVLILTVASSEALIRVNAGGGEYTDGSGYLWSADYGYNTGLPASTSDPISGTTDDVLYQSERWDRSASPELVYSFNVPDGGYTVNLYFVDLYDGTAGVGLRVFDVLIEGQMVLDDLDIFSEVGHDAALIKSFAVTVSDGQLNIEFLHQIQDPKISAIEVISQDDTEPPTIPTGLSGTPVSSTQIDLTWDPSTDTGGSGLAGYRVYRDGVEVGTAALTAFSDTGLIPDTTYTYTVSAYDNAGNESAQSSSVDITTLTAPDTEPPTIPTGLSGTPVSSTQIDLTWDPSTDTGGSGLAGYRVYRDGVEVGTAALTAFSDTGLIPDTTYTYTVSAYDNAGNESAQSDPIIVTTLSGGLALIRVNAGGGEYIDGSGYLWSADYGYNTGLPASTSDPISGTTDDVLYQSERWDRSASPELVYSFNVPDGGYTVNLYFVDLYDGTAGAGLRVFDVLIEGQLVLDDLDIYSEVGHDAALIKSFAVTVSDGQLNIEFLHQIQDPKISAIEVISQDDMDPPSVPTGLAGTAVSSDQIDLTWNASTDTGGSGLAGYRVYRDSVEVGTATLTAFSDTGLNPDTMYTYTVSAYDNALNESGQSSSVDITTLTAPDTDPPTIPTGLSGTPVSSTQIDLTWNASTDTGGSGLAGYRVYRDGVEIDTTAETNYSDTGLAPDTEYTYTVSAYDNAGNESAQSDPIIVTTLSGGLALIRVNAGGEEYIDGSGYLWSADYGYNTGLPASTSDPISGTTDDVLYQSERWDPSVSPELVYIFNVPDGDYTVNLYFVDLYDGTAGVGLRVFDVLIEGQLVLDDLDIFSEVGHDAALIKSFAVTVSGGQLDIEFLHQIQDPKISAIEVMSGSTVSLPFSDDFDDGVADGWSVVDDSGNISDWQVISGEYYQQINVEEMQTGGQPFDETYHIGTYSFLPLGISLTDYRFSVQATPLSEKGHDIGVMFRYRDNNNYYRLSFSSKYGFSRLEKKIAGSFIPLATNSRGYFIEQQLNITVELTGNLIQIYLNGDPLFSVSDSSFGSGGVALYCQDKAKFDNILIEENSFEPAVVISSPVAHSVTATDMIGVSAIATNVPLDGWIEFLLDGVVMCEPAFEESEGLYTSECLNISQGEHTLDAILYESVSQLAIDTNEKIGVLGDYYVSVGDSITNGTGDNYSYDNTSEDERILAFQGYESNLSDLLTGTLSYSNIIFNEGIPGDESYDAAYKRIESILFRHPGSNKILILLGTNDSGGALSVPSGSGCSETSCAGTFKENMQLLIDEVIDYGKLPVVGLVPPTLPGPLNSSRNLLIQEYNSVITSELTGIDIGPDFFSFFLSPTYNHFSLFADSVHPNALGYAVMAYLWHNTLTGGELEPFILQDLEPSTVDPYLKQNLLEVGDTYYVDEEYTLTNIPPELNGGIWIMTANSERFNMESDYLFFSVDRNVEVYVGYDHGATAPPDWLENNFNLTGGVIGVTDPGTSVLGLYKAAFGPGTITLGGNLAVGASGASSSYVVIVVANN